MKQLIHFIYLCNKESLEIPKGLPEAVNQERTDNANSQKNKYKSENNDLQIIKNYKTNVGLLFANKLINVSSNHSFITWLYNKELITDPTNIEVDATRSLVLYVCFVDRCLSFCPFSFGHCVVCTSSIYGF